MVTTAHSLRTKLTKAVSMAESQPTATFWQSNRRSINKRIGRLLNGIRNFAYPASLQSLWIILAITTALQFTKRNFPLDLHGQSICCRLVACSAAALSIWVCFCLTLRYTLKMLLTYKGWMYESRAKGSQVSLATRLWAMSIKLLIMGNKPGLFSFQRSLPRLPVPSVKDTIPRFLETVRPLLDQKQFERMQGLANDFEQTIATKLQRYLIAKSWWSSNYVTDWWEEYVYLRGRNPLMINSNYYCLDVTSAITTHIQSARAASIVHWMLRVRRLIDREELEPIMGQKLVPLCSWQYKRLFNTVREPGIETDRLVHYHDTDHIVVMHKGCYYKVNIHKGRLLKPAEIQVQLEEILQSKTKPLPGEERLAALTAWDRTKWAEVRNEHFSKGINAELLRTIESAAFILCLDDEPYEMFNTETNDGLDHLARSMFYGNGHNRWFDKSYNFCVGSNARIGFNSEHTWADAIIMGHLWELTLKDDVDEQPYDEHGNCKGQLELQPPSPERLPWNLNDACLSKINEAYEDGQKLINELQLRVLIHNRYGKGFMKKCGVSPDAFVQMALQLAYYRDAGRLTLTYEASMTRLFLEGRTETVRSVTMESAAWVKSMDDSKSTNEHRISLLRKACERHQNGYRDAMCGKGTDRHLFGLYVVSKYLELDSPFLKEALGEPWRLSTSQSPHGQTSRVDHRHSAGGGFGAVTFDGYGVSYMITGEDELNIHVTSKASCPTTDAKLFADKIERAMADMQNLFE